MAVTGTTAKDVKAAAAEEAKRRKEELKQAWKERKKQMDEQVEMHARLDARPFLFEQASIDVAVERAKAAAHDRRDAEKARRWDAELVRGWGRQELEPVERHRDRAPRSILCAATRARGMPGP